MSNCKEIGCKVKNSTYGLFDKYKKIGLFCANHKKDGMINVVHPRCQEIDCKLGPSFNFEDQTKGIYCSMFILLYGVNINILV